MLHALVTAVEPHQLRHLNSRDLAVRAGKGQALVARGLHSAGLVDMDVTALGADRTLVGPQCGGDQGHVGLCAAHQEVDSRILPGAFLTDVVRSGTAVVIGAVAGGLLVIGLDQPLQDALMAAFAVIAGKIDHGYSSFSLGPL